MSGRRSTRRSVTQKAVDYAREQEFSDANDVFEDSEEEPAPKRKSKPRKSTPSRANVNAANANAATTTIDPDDLDDEGGYQPSKPIYTEKGYDPNLLPIRERFSFLPEFEPDGSPRIDLIVGRRPIDEKGAVDENGDSNENRNTDGSQDGSKDEDGGSDEDGGRRKSGKRGEDKKNKNESSPSKKNESEGPVEYEYLVKYKNRSYLHLEWKTGADLESMNKSAKTLYRRYLKKLAQGLDDELEDPNFDPSFAETQKIVDEADQEIVMELSDKELLKWEKEREKTLADEESDSEMEIEGPNNSKDKEAEEEKKADSEAAPKETSEEKKEDVEDWKDEEIDFSQLTLDRLGKIIDKDGPYFPVFEGCDNPYRDGYVTEPPKKPRASYLFFQCTMRSYFAKRNPEASQGELMTILGDHWRKMSEAEQQPFVELAKEEVKQYDKERSLMERAQRPNEMWQPIRRCLMVLDRVADDGFANIFREPVDMEEFNDYEEFVDTPMDLGTVRTKLKAKKYQSPEQFARDVRKVWNNCKIYNRHGSAIWHVADYMSKQFERLYHAWVQEFRERYLRWANPKARPWEHTCRQCDAKCGTPDNEMVLCDHCDAMYGFKCLKPPLKKLPTGIWHCPDCKPKLKTVKGVRMMSAISEQAARKRAELGDTPKRKVKQTMYLVKWAGLGYEYCTWETKEDIGNPSMLAEYQKLNNSFPDEADMPVEVAEEVLDSANHLNTKIAGGVDCIPDLRSQLYAQTRAFQFTKFGMDIPELVCGECGPITKAAVVTPVRGDKTETSTPKEVLQCLTELTYRVSWKQNLQLIKVNASLPPLMTGEYDAIIPITAKGLMMNVGEIHGSVAFLGYRQFPDGSKGPAELKKLIRNVGDKIIAVDGMSTVSKTFKEVIGFLRESGKNKYAFMRFLENKYAVCDGNLASVGNSGRYAIEELQKKFTTDRKQLIVQRKQQLGQEEQEEAEKGDDTDASAEQIDSDEESDGSEGEFQPDSDDEELQGAVKEPKLAALSAPQQPTDSNPALLQPSVAPASDPVLLPSVAPASDPVLPQPSVAPASDPVLPQPSVAPASDPVLPQPSVTPASDPVLPQPSVTPASDPAPTAPDAAVTSSNDVAASSEEEKKATEGETPTPSASADVQDENVKKLENPDGESGDVQGSIVLRPETTQSLAYRLLAVDVGYSSDEGGDEDCAYYVDGVDGTFTSMKDLPEDVVESAKVVEEKKEKSKATDKEKKEEEEEAHPTLPVRRSDFSSLGDRSKLTAAIALTSRPPDVEDFDNFPMPSTKQIEAQKEKVRGLEASKALAEENGSPGMPVKLSTVKVEQVSIATNEPIHVWASAESAAATLQISADQIKLVLTGEYDEDLGDEVGGFRWRYAAAGAAVTAANAQSKKKGSKQGKEAWLAFRDRLYDPNVPHLYKNGNRLRDYQVEGVNWLASTYYRKQGCILADEMGLGKTVQIVSYLEHLYRVEKIERPFLVVVPLSTVEHWRREFEGWSDMVACVYHDRQRVWRDVLREYEWYYDDRPHNADFLKFDILVTTYDTLIGDFDVISQIPFRVAVVDEAHRLRNQKGKLLECMKEISARGTLQYGFQSRVLMSGTPLQNDLTELWTLLNFIEPYKFPDLNDFQFHYGNMANKEQVESLQRKISPYMLRRVKEDVAKDIPAKEETVIDVELTSIQKQYYRAIFEHNHAFLNMGSSRATAPKLMNIQMELRKVCNHPCLIDGVEHREQEKQFKEFHEEGKFEGKAPEEQQHMLNEHVYIMTSGKMVLLDKLLPKLRQEGHKVLIFSQMVKMLDLISEYCDFRHYPHERLDGRVRGSDRQKAIDRFEREENSFLFLLSTRAGGVGINLTAADVCIIFDSDWNPQNDVQAQARCHRIGQTKDVRIYRLVTSRTFEQEMFDRASRKLGLEQAVLGSFGQDDDDDKPTNKEMEQLLKKGAYALLEDENDEEGKAFCADDIDNILAKRTRTRVVEGTKTASWLNKQGMCVSKSKFTSDSKTAGLDMDDPLFWQKVMPDFVTPSIILQKLQDLSDEILGTGGKGRGKGRGRGRKPKQAETSGGAEKSEDALIGETVEGSKEAENTTTDAETKSESDPSPHDKDADMKEADDDDADMKEDEDAVDDKDGDTSGAEEKEGKFQLTRTHVKKIAKFISDLKSMMEGIFDEADDDTLPSEEKAICQKLLLTVSVKEKLFNEQQRHMAKLMLKRLEGNRRRRCRTSDQSPRRPRNVEGGDDAVIRDELKIVGKKRRKRRTKAEMEADRAREAKLKERGDSDDDSADVGDDGYLVHSDDEADWSDIGEDVYLAGKKRSGISRKEARRRRQWAADDDAATAAGRAWPAFPRPMVSKVLGTVLEEVVKHDDAKGGVFSVPVPKDEFPEYYEQIKQPMDYGTMKKKLDNGEYRSVQAMQKDFVLVMQNCLNFNAPDSEIVQEARQQALMKPNILRRAALAHDLFLAEDGSVLEVYDDDKKKSKGKENGEETPKKQRRRKKAEGTAEETPIPRKKRGKKKAESGGSDDSDEDDVPLTSLRKKKPRIRISLGESGEKEKSPKKKPGKRRRSDATEDDEDGSDEDAIVEVKTTPIPRKRRRASSAQKTAKAQDDEKPKRRGRTKSGPHYTEPDSDDEPLVALKTSDSNDDTEEPPIKRKSARKEKETHVAELDKDSESSLPVPDPTCTMLDPAVWKKEREALADDKFGTTRSHFQKRGAWAFPPTLADDKFRDVALTTLNKMGKHDRYSVFAEAVSESEAPGYYEVVKHSMDLAKMKTKVEQNKYGEGSTAAATFYRDFLLMFDNCNIYNDEDGEVIEEAARLFALVPEIYSGACMSLLKKLKKSAA